jgi:hypothetical protein
MNRIQWIWYLRFYYYHWGDTFVGGLLVPEAIIYLVMSASKTFNFPKQQIVWKLVHFLKTWPWPNLLIFDFGEFQMTFENTVEGDCVRQWAWPLPWLKQKRLVFWTCKAIKFVFYRRLINLTRGKCARAISDRKYRQLDVWFCLILMLYM